MEVLLVTGVLTAGVGAGIVAPRLVIRVLTGADGTDAAAVFFARYCSLLVALVGLLLIYAAYNPPARLPAMIFGATEKFGFGAFVLMTPLRTRATALLFAGADVVMAILYVVVMLTGGVP